jgi:transposase
MTSYGSVWRIVREAGVTFKKNTVRRRAAAAEDRAPAGAVEEVSGAA